MQDFKPRLDELQSDTKWQAINTWSFIAIVFLAGLFFGGYFLTLQ